MNKRKRTNNDLQNTTQKTKNQVTRTSLFIYVLGRDGIPLTSLTLPHLCACPKPEFQHHMS